MATSDDLRRSAMALEGTTSAPHFERTAFKIARIYATLGPDDLTANLKLTETTLQLGCPADSALPIGVLLLACTRPYAFPRTSVLGAVLLTGYLGGAVATHARPWLTKTRNIRKSGDSHDRDT